MKVHYSAYRSDVEHRRQEQMRIDWNQLIVTFKSWKSGSIAWAAVFCNSRLDPQPRYLLLEAPCIPYEHKQCSWQTTTAFVIQNCVEKPCCS